MKTEMFFFRKSASKRADAEETAAAETEEAEERDAITKGPETTAANLISRKKAVRQLMQLRIQKNKLKEAVALRILSAAVFFCLLSFNLSVVYCILRFEYCFLQHLSGRKYVDYGTNV